jgi:hypothetical protein
MGAASALRHAQRRVEMKLEQDAFTGWVAPFGTVLFSDSCLN